MDKFELDQLKKSDLTFKEQGSNQEIIKYIKHWPWFITLALVGIIIGFISYKLSKPVYQVESKILIKGESNPLQSDISIDEIFGKKASSNMANQIEMLQSFTNYKQAISNLNWNATWYIHENPVDKEIYKSAPFDLAIPLDANNLTSIKLQISHYDQDGYTITVNDKAYYNGIKQKIKFKANGKWGAPFKNEYVNFILYLTGKPDKNEYYFYINNINKLARSYLNKVNVDIPNENSEVIKMQLEGNIPQKEADFLNELNNVFIRLGVQEEERNSENSVSFINEQLSKIKDSLENVEKTYSDYRKKNKVVDLSQEANFIYQKLEDVETEKYEANIKLEYFKNLQNYLDDSKRIKQISSPSVSGIDDPNLTSMLQKLMELYNRREVLSYSVKEKSPSYILLEKEIDMIKNSLNENLTNLISNTETEISSINKRNSEIQNRLQKLPDTEKELIGIQRGFELNNTMYNYMLKKKAEAELSKASTAPKVQIIDKALPEASVQVGPNLLTNIGLGLGLGFIIPFLIIFILDNFNTTIENKEEVDKKTDLPVLEGILYTKTKGLLPVMDNPRSGLSESFRGLRHNIKNLLNHEDNTIISINSMNPGEGKSFIASNLAATMSMLNKKVLLINADIRKPRLENIFGDNNGKGLSNFLASNANITDIIFETKIENLSFIPAGEVPPNPTELLENGKFQELLTQFKTSYDYIVLDNAPLSLVADGMITSKFSDLCLFVLRINKSKRKQVKQINETVDFHKIDTAAIVINGKNSKGLSKGYVKKGYGDYKY